MAQSKTSSRRIVAREREQRALDMRKDGARYRDIAAALDMSLAGAHKVVTRALRRHAETLSETAHEVLQLELLRLDAMFAAVWPEAMAGDCRAVTTALRVMERRARLLGLDARAETDITADEQPLVVRLNWPEDQRTHSTPSEGLRVAENGSQPPGR